MSLFMKLVFSATGPRTLRQFRARCRDPAGVQTTLLRQILRENRETAFGRDHGFSSIETFEDFRKTVPVTTYEDVSPYVEAARNGQKAQLTAETPVLFATTSGTTGDPKYIPVTPESRSAKSQLMRVWLSSLHRDHPGVFSGGVLTIVSPEVESYSPCGIPCGSESGHGYKNMPNAVKSMYVCPYDVYEIKNYEARYYTILRMAAARPVTLLYTCNPSTVLLLAQYLGRFSENIIRDVRDGALSDAYEIPPELRASIGGTLSPDPRRATFLEDAASRGGGRLLPREVWPDLAAIACWKGGTVGIYVDKFDQYYPPGVPVRDIGYFASEHRGSVPIDDEGPAGVLAIPTNVYEFLPAEENAEGCDGKELLSVEDLQPGRQYFVFVTTHAGLCRYHMNDIIEVTGYYEKTPVIRFVQKGKGVVSFTGEKLYEQQVLAAADEALVAGNPEFITAVGEMRGDQPRYAFLVEFEQPPGEADCRRMLEKLEICLRRQNLEYAAKRESLRIGAPVLVVVKHGEFDRYRRRECEKGKHDGQFKILRLTTDTSFLREFEVVRETTLPVK